MSETFLEKIVAKTRERVERAKAVGYVDSIRRRAEGVRQNAEPRRFLAALSQRDRTNIIAEIKRASPSKGTINANIDVGRTARSYETGGAAAISVLTESEYFCGEIRDLVIASKTVDIPILRKDFTVDAYQIYEAAAAGADAVLLIVAALSREELVEFGQVTRELGMDALVEVHSADEFEIAHDIGAEIIGVNNRDLHSLEVSLEVSRDLIRHKPEGVLMVSESGITSRDDILELKSLGFDGFLVGETLMRSGDPGATLKEWV
ncbi:MAG: indole-3-glycerol phosphate synthase TrpC [Acidobacteriota bacterium]